MHFIKLKMAEIFDWLRTAQPAETTAELPQHAHSLRLCAKYIKQTNS
jgi:hypothetical protein